jgi:hypothetical protein
VFLPPGLTGSGSLAGCREAAAGQSFPALPRWSEAHAGSGPFVRFVAAGREQDEQFSYAGSYSRSPPGPDESEE